MLDTSRASTWPPTVVGGDMPGRAHGRALDLLQRGRRPSSAETLGATSWRPARDALQRGRRPSSAETPDGGDATLVQPRLQRGRRPSSAETRRDRQRCAGRGGASTWPPTVVGGDRRAREAPARRPRHASTWPPTVVGGDLDRLERHVHHMQLQRGRRPSSAETGVGRHVRNVVDAASTWPPTVVGGDDAAPTRKIGVPTPLQRGRRPSSAETGVRARADRRRDLASTWPPTVVGGDRPTRAAAP